MAPKEGFEPPTRRLTAACSTTELLRNEGLIDDARGAGLSRRTGREGLGTCRNRTELPARSGTQAWAMSPFLRRMLRNDLSCLSDSCRIFSSSAWVVGSMRLNRSIAATFRDSPIGQLGDTLCALRVELAVLMFAMGCNSSQPATAPRVELVEAPAAGDVAAYVAQQVTRGEREHVPVLVYVGATWCEPCHELQAAAASGSLDSSLAPLRLLVFDLDRDRDRLEAAGYRSDLVPLLAKPNRDGRASRHRTDGVRTGGGYVEQLVPRIRALVAATR
jgi:hypothetical protein